MHFRMIILMVALGMSMPAAGQEVSLMPVADGDFTIQGRVSPLRDDVTQAQGVQGQAANVFMPADGRVATSPLAAPENDSRSYRLSVSARELAEGVSLPLTATGAVLRLNPVPGTGGRALAPDDLSIRQGAWALRGRDAAEDLADGEALNQAAPVFGRDSLALRLSERIGAGEALLQVRESALIRGGRYQVHVFEPESRIQARLTAERPIVALGDALSASGELLGEAGLAVTQVTGAVVSPDGRRYPLDWRVDGAGGIAATPSLPPVSSQSDGLWELEARIQGEGPRGPVRRDVRLAFEGVAATARLNGKVALAGLSEGWGLRVGVEVGSPGRYEVRATLPGVGTAHSARWLESGHQELLLRFPGRMPARAVLEDLRLVDQSRTALLHVQQRGLILGDQAAIMTTVDAF